MPAAPVTAAGISTREVAPLELDALDLERWRDLAGRAAEANPFFEPAFLLPSIRHLGGGPEVRALIVEEDGRWLAFMPVRARRLGGVLKCLSSWRHLYCFIDTPLVDSVRLEPAVTALVALARRRAGGGLLTFERLGDDGPVAESIADAARRAGLAPIFERRFERATLRRRPEQTYMEGLRAHHRRDHERLWRRLDRELGGELAVEDRAGDPAAIERFLAMELAGWKGSAGSALGCNPADAEFFRAVAAGFAAQGRLQLLELGRGSEVVAMKCNLIAGGVTFCFKITHDERFDRCSPGVQMERAHVDVFHDRRAEQWMDSCAEPTNEMINRLWPDRRRISTVVLARSGSRSAVLGYALRRAYELRRRQGAKAA